MSDSLKSIYLKRYIIASEFIMDSDIYTVFIHLQDSFTRELIIQSKIILEEITQVGSDITLLIENCERIQYVYIIYLIDFVNIIKEKDKNHHRKTLDVFSEEHNKGHHPGVHHLRKDLIKFDIVLDILDIIGHFAQRGHQSPTTIKSDIIAEYHLLDFSSISGPNHFSVTSAFNSDIIVNMEKFIRIAHLWYTYHINALNMNDIIKPEQPAEYLMLDYISISKFSYPSATGIKAEHINSNIFAEYHLLDYICINGPNYIPVIGVINLDIVIKADRFIRIICPSHINLFIKTKGLIKIVKVKPCLPHHYGNISHISYDFNSSSSSIDIFVKKEKFISIIFITYINLLYNNLDINIKAERFIRNHHSYIYSVKSINREAPSGDHRLVLKSHRGASSMSTSEEHIIYMQDIMVKQEDNQTSCILTILSAFISNHFIFIESIVDNHFHIILVALHQWEALDITHSCPSGNGARRSHLIEWKETNKYILIKNIDHMDITHQKNVCFIYTHYIYVKQDHIVTYDIKADLSSRSITQDISIIDTIIYDTTAHHIKICDSFGTIIVDDIDLSSMTKEYIIIGLIDFMKHPSEDIDIIFNYIILEKKDLDIRANTFNSHILEFIITTPDINPTQQFSNISQSDNIIIDYIIQIDIYSIYHPFIFYLDISSHNITMVGIMDYHIDQIITDLVISLQSQKFIHNQITTLPTQQQLNIIHHTTSVSIIHYRVDFKLEHLINHLESYITFHLRTYFTFNITLDISYVNQFIIELYNTILETEVIRNVNSDEISYMDIKIPESYITTGDADIFVYLIINTVKLIDSIRETRTIIVAEDRANIKIINEESEESSASCCLLIKIIVLIYVFIFALKGDSIIVKTEDITARR